MALPFTVCERVLGLYLAGCSGSQVSFGLAGTKAAVLVNCRDSINLSSLEVLEGVVCGTPDK